MTAESGAPQRDQGPLFPRLVSHTSHITQRKTKAVTCLCCFIHLKNIDWIQMGDDRRTIQVWKRGKDSLKVLSECVIMCNYLSACAAFLAIWADLFFPLSSVLSTGWLISPRLNRSKIYFISTVVALGSIFKIHRSVVLFFLCGAKKWRLPQKVWTLLVREFWVCRGWNSVKTLENLGF